MPGPDRPKGTHSVSREPFRLLPLGDSAVTVTFGDKIDPAINTRVVAFANSIESQRWPGILDIVPAYCSVTIHFNALDWDWSTLTDRLRALPRLGPSETESHGTMHTIPVLYGSEWGPDLEDVAAFAGLTTAHVIALHASIHYRVFMLGFSPGFPYLGIVPERLAMPRLSSPRIKVPAGSVGIADRQTGIYPSATPGGWRLIGRTPVSLYEKTGPRPFLMRPGDRVQFKSIERDEFDRLSREATRDDR